MVSKALKLTESPFWQRGIVRIIASFAVGALFASLVQWPFREKQFNAWRTQQTSDAVLDLASIAQLEKGFSSQLQTNTEEPAITVEQEMRKRLAEVERTIAKGELTWSEDPNDTPLAAPQIAWSVEPSGFHRLKVSMSWLQNNGKPVKATVVRRFDVVMTRQIAGNAWLLPGIVGTFCALGMSAYLRVLDKQRQQLHWVERLGERLHAGTWQSQRDDIPKVEPAWVLGVYAIADSMHEQIARVQRSNANSSLAMTNMPIGVLTFDSRLVLQFANPAGRQLLDIDKAAEGQRLIEVLRIPSIVENVLASHQSGKPSEAEIEMSRTKTWLRIKVQTLNESNTTQGNFPVLVTVTDETRLKQLENLRRDFTANVSHELKTPLAAIKAYAETLQMGALDDPEAAERFVERICEQASRLDALIRDLLQLTRLQSQPDKPELTSLSIVDCIESALEDHRAVASSRGIELEFIANTDCRVRSELEALQTILSNLLTNAIRYNKPSGKVTVSVNCHENECAVRIQDTGIGIPPEDLDRIFERFYRVEKARSQELGGTGLGLAIVKHLCQSISASIRVESDLGVGSCFEVHLPLEMETSRRERG